jgi:hypothetical protein
VFEMVAILESDPYASLHHFGAYAAITLAAYTGYKTVTFFSKPLLDIELYQKFLSNALYMEQIGKLKESPLSFDRSTVILCPSKRQAIERFCGLGENWWMQIIDGKWHMTRHNLGPLVFDQGLHKGEIEPGFFSSIENAHKFALAHLTEKTTVDFYLNVHKLACAHFKKNAEDYRNKWVDNSSSVTSIPSCEDWDTRCAEISNHIKTLCDKLNIKNPFAWIEKHGDKISVFHEDTDLFGDEHNFQEQIRVVTERLLNDYHENIASAKDADQKLKTIAFLHQMLEWFHPFNDGTTRTNLILLEKHLTENGFTPAIFFDPNWSLFLSFNDWLEYLKLGMSLWQMKAKLLDTRSPFQKLCSSVSGFFHPKDLGI